MAKDTKSWSWSDDDLYMFRFFSHYHSDAKNENTKEEVQQNNIEPKKESKIFQEFNGSPEKQGYCFYDEVQQNIRINNVYSNKFPSTGGEFCETLLLYSRLSIIYIFYKSWISAKMSSTAKWILLGPYDTDKWKIFVQKYEEGLKFEDLKLFIP